MMMMRRRSNNNHNNYWFLFLLAIVALISVVTANAPSPQHPTIPSFVKVVQSAGQSALTKSIPALNVYRGTTRTPPPKKEGGSLKSESSSSSRSSIHAPHRLPISIEVKSTTTTQTQSDVPTHSEIQIKDEDDDELSEPTITAKNFHYKTERMIPRTSDNSNNNNNVRIIRSRRRLKQLPFDAAAPPAILHVVKQKVMKRRLKVPKVPPIRNLSIPKVPLEEVESSGIYYGITKSTLEKANQSSGDDAKNRRPRSVQQSMHEALEELRTMRQEMEKMRLEMESMKQSIISEEDNEDEGMSTRSGDGAANNGSSDAAAQQKASAQALRRRQKEYDKIAAEVERWAEKLIYEETEEDGWSEVNCNKMMRQKLNASGQTKAYIKWMKDSRGALANAEDKTDYPCIKVLATIDAPMDTVCAYLSQESAFPEYNDVVTDYKDVEEISSHSKICWSQSPQILFLKPRDFVTFCHHRWRRDGSAVIVNQATEHPDYPGRKEEREGKACRAYAIRGANFISRCPDDPEKTQIAIIAHADPGGNVPQWAARTAVNALAPVEPFKLFHKINMNVQNSIPQLREKMAEMEMVSLPGGRSPKPTGIAQLGYACFWPNGGGLQEGGYKPNAPPKSNFTESNDNALDDGGLKESGTKEEPLIEIEPKGEATLADDGDAPMIPVEESIMEKEVKPQVSSEDDTVQEPQLMMSPDIDPSQDPSVMPEEETLTQGMLPENQEAPIDEQDNKQDPMNAPIEVEPADDQKAQQEQNGPRRRRNRMRGGRK